MSSYKKHTHREHILSLPDTYVGSIENCSEEMYVVEGETFQLKTIKNFNPGFYKLFDEILVNAHDHVVRCRQRKADHMVKNITIEISADNKTITVENDGDGIDIQEHPEYKVWVPQLVFGELLTSTNYDKEEKKLVGGKNGYGVKLANIFGKRLTIETVDASRMKKYVQSWEENMTKVLPPKITGCKTKPYVSVAWTPDFARFGLTEITPELLGVFRRRATDLAMTVGKDVKVHWKHGDEKITIKCRDLSVYAQEFVTTPVVVHTSDRWSVAVADTPVDKHLQVSFVNGIWTSKGGTHVDYIVNQVVSNIAEYLETKKKIKVKPSLIKENLAVWVTAEIENPSFNSQTKETLTTKSSAFGSTCKLPEEFFKKVRAKLELVDTLIVSQKEKDDKENKKSDGKKQSKIYGIPKLEDAAWAGTARGSECTLILTEGDSAKAMALSGLTKTQRQSFGVFPLRGKIMNVKDSTASKVELVKEIAELKKIVGLESGRVYLDTKSLRYGRILIMTDQDYDGSHIRGLLINLFHELWPELFALPGFLTYMATPIVKATKGKETQTFYTQYEYEQWKEHMPTGWTIQYYKGLGTSTRDEAQEYFKNMNITRFRCTPEESSKSIDLAFNKSRADDRKVWLQGHSPSAIVIPATDRTLSYEEFVHRDLIHFSYYNLERSIPSVMDGLKTSQRKILFGCFKRNLTSRVKVAQLAGYVSEHAGYHHGEMSLNETIIGMAQDFVGSNNLAWLVPKGQFGTRLEGGKDSAASRYIFTYLQPYMKRLVPADDLPVLAYRDDDGISVEPDWYAPVLPMLLVNGARGIGTGYSTFIPSYDPNVLKGALVRWLEGGCDDAVLAQQKLVPWARGFKGTIDSISDGDFMVTAKYTYVPKTKTVMVTDLPIGYWTGDFKKMLDAYCEKKEVVRDYTDTSTDCDVNFEIVLFDELPVQQMEKVLGLTEKIKTTNMHAFDPSGKIRRYSSPNEMLVEYAHARLGLYGKRRENILRELRAKLPWHTEVVRFLTLMCNDVIDLRKKPMDACRAILKTHDLHDTEGLLKLPFSSITQENIDKHQAELDRLNKAISEMDKTAPFELWIADLGNLVV